MSTLLERFHVKVDRRGEDECWLWIGARSRSGRREVDYGEVRDDWPSVKIWRAHRLALMLHTGPRDVPVDPGERFADWLRRVDQWYRGLEASHACDVSMCVNPRHLSWERHAVNVSQQKERRARARRQEACA